jgi:hypothetical protein
MIMAMACMMVTFCSLWIATTTFASLLILVLLVIEALAVLRIPKKVFQKRLNSYFIVIRCPFYKWNIIFQSAGNKDRLRSTGADPCKNFYHDLSRQIVEMFIPSNWEHGYYRTITHPIIKNHLERLQSKGNLQIITCEAAYHKDMANIQKSLLHNRCKSCKDVACCPYRNATKKIRQFYYIEFYVPKELKDCGHE